MIARCSCCYTLVEGFLCIAQEILGNDGNLGRGAHPTPSKFLTNEDSVDDTHVVGSRIPGQNYSAVKMSNMTKEMYRSC